MDIQQQHTSSGFPNRLHHDQGHEFENDLFHTLGWLSGVRYSRTSPYHPQCNPEHFNRTLLQMLRILTDREKEKWKKTFAYDCTCHESTGYSPHYLLYGQHPRFPVDLLFGLLGNAESVTHKGYVKKLSKRMMEEILQDCKQIQPVFKCKEQVLL